MSEFTRFVCTSILPRSIAQTLPRAFREWRFTENTIDHGGPIETCQLCGKEKIRYHFEIGNEQTDENLWVGSHCILKFDVAVMDGGIKLSPEKAKQRLDKLTKRMQYEACLKALFELTEKEPQNAILSGALERYKRDGKLTPKQAAVVFWRVAFHQVENNASFFNVEMKTNQHIEDVRNMESRRLHLFWGALSTSQRKKAISLGHLPPAGS